MKNIYLDSAATTFVKPSSVAKALYNAVNTLSSPGRGGYSSAMAAAETAFRCREKAALLFGSEAERIVFTMNATHALNIAIRSVVKPGSRVIISGYEHNSVTRPLRALEAETVPVRSKLFSKEDALTLFESEIKNGADAVICTHVSNVFGFILPVYEIAGMCRANGIPFILDASQSAGVLDVDMRRLGASFICMPGHKGLYGPQGTGILICGDTPKPFLFGGTGSLSKSYDMPDFLPDMLEAGTHNMPGISGLEAGLDFVIAKMPQRIAEHEKMLISYAAYSLEALNGIHCFYDKSFENQSGVLSFTADGTEAEEISRILSQKGIATRAGFHCSPLAHETAGTADSGTVRISVSAFSTLSDINALVSAMSRKI